MHVLSDVQGIPLAVAVPARTCATASPSSRSSAAYPPSGPAGGPRWRRPVKLRADKAYFSAEHLARLRERGSSRASRPPGIESGQRLGRHRWKIERSIAWLFGHRRLTVR
ncbi:hypothetical protein [Streptomyces sp. NPDC059874]|uniref:hypothetical protein n=1 Tax=Streptomyces sp. NPDC059874 TaxID=3346983 RepID=UPI003666F490